jgi:hypothetical protein
MDNLIINNLNEIMSVYVYVDNIPDVIDENKYLRSLSGEER